MEYLLWEGETFYTPEIKTRFGLQKGVVDFLGMANFLALVN